MPSKDWVKCKGEKGIYKRKKKDKPNKYDYLLIYHLGYTEEFDEKTGKNRRKENQSQKVFPGLKEKKHFRGSIQKERRKVQRTVNVSRRLYFCKCYQELLPYGRSRMPSATVLAARCHLYYSTAWILICRKTVVGSHRIMSLDNKQTKLKK